MGSRDGYDNPHGTVPSPAPNATYRPVGYWDTEECNIGWGVPAAAILAGGRVSMTGVWTSTILDMRPDTIDATQKPNPAFRMQRLAGAQFFVFVRGLLSNHVGMECYTQVLGHPTDVSKVAGIEAPRNATAELSTGIDTACLYWLPFSGYPMRFLGWRIRFDFQCASASLPVPLPRISLQAGVY